MELIIPFNLRGKDLWVEEPPYMRKDGAKFVMNDELSEKDREWLVECGIPLVERATKTVAKKKKTEEKTEKDKK